MPAFATADRSSSARRLGAKYGALQIVVRDSQHQGTVSFHTRAFCLNNSETRWSCSHPAVGPDPSISPHSALICWSVTLNPHSGRLRTYCGPQRLLTLAVPRRETHFVEEAMPSCRPLSSRLYASHYKTILGTRHTDVE